MMCMWVLIAVIGMWLYDFPSTSCCETVFLSLDCCCYLVTQLCQTLCDPMDCGPQGSSLHGIPQVGTLEWVPIAFSGESSQPGESNPGLLHWQAGSLPLRHVGSPPLLLDWPKLSLKFFHNIYRKI